MKVVELENQLIAWQKFWVPPSNSRADFCSFITTTENRHFAMWSEY